VLFETAERLDPGPWRLAALLALGGAHDALRLRFRQGGRGLLHGGEHPAGNLGRAPAACRIDLAVRPKSFRKRPSPRRSNASAPWPRGASTLAAGPPHRALSLDLGAARPGGRSLLDRHHLVIDGVSWRILLEESGAA